MIELKNASKSFKAHKAIDKLTLKVASGEIFGLLGSNGAGKSTAINLLLGILKLDEGVISVNQLDITKNSNKTRSIIGYIPENVNLYPYLTGLENLDYFCLLAGLRYSKTELNSFLGHCGLQKNNADKRVKTYSKGMRHKVGIAIAYAKKAKVYLLDEPASGLDPLASNELSKLLKELASEGACILMATHDLFRAREVCNRIGILKNGKLVRELSSESVTATELEQLYLTYMQN